MFPPMEGYFGGGGDMFFLKAIYHFVLESERIHSLYSAGKKRAATTLLL